MIIHDQIQQGSADWLKIRSGRVTASECDALISPKGKIREGSGVKSYLALKLAEWFLDGPVISFFGGAAEQGSILEESAFAWYEMEFNQPLERVGFISTDCGHAGCSPDALINREIGVEIKSLQPKKHCEVLLDGVLPEDFLIQVQMSLWVTKFKAWRFVAFNRAFPPLVLTVEPDTKIQSAISEALDCFFRSFEEGKAKLIKLNGGEPARFTPSPEPIKFSWEDQSDVGH